jgi:hypothetical protein
VTYHAMRFAIGSRLLKNGDHFICCPCCFHTS